MGELPSICPARSRSWSWYPSQKPAGSVSIGSVTQSAWDWPPTGPRTSPELSSFCAHDLAGRRAGHAIGERAPYIDCQLPAVYGFHVDSAWPVALPLDLEVINLAIEGCSTDAQQFGCFRHVAARALQRSADQAAFPIRDLQRVQVIGAGIE